MFKHLTLAAVLVAAAPAWAGNDGDYYGGGPLTPSLPALAPYPQPGTSSLYTPLPYPPPHPSLPLGYGSQQRLDELQQQNRLQHEVTRALSEEWAQQVLRDALRR